MLELLIENGTVIDGTGDAGTKANVGIENGRIVYVGPDQPEAEKVIDAAGKYVTPGFVDVHTHYDAQVMWDPNLDPHPRHGFTSIVLGNCGFSLAPITPETAEYLVPMLSKVEAIPLETLRAGVDINWSTTAEMFDRVDGHVTPNIAFGTGHSALRTLVMGERAHTEKATPEDIEKMQALLRESLEAGSVSFSSSHADTHRDHKGDPVPSLIADREELLALASQVKDYEGTHLGFVSSVGIMTDETKALVADMSLAGQRTVNWPLFVPGQLPEELAENQLSTADFARERGAEVRVQCSSQPQDVRINFKTGLGYDTYPGVFKELYHLPLEARMERMKEPETRKQMQVALDEVAQSANPVGIFAKLELFTVDASSHPDNAAFVGRKVVDIAAEQGCSVLDVCLDIAIRDDLKTTFLVANFPEHTKEGWALIARSLADDRTLWAATDGGAHVDVLFGASHATSFLSNAVRDHQVMPIEQAIHLFTQVPAEYVGVRDRGVIREGACADLLVIDLDRLETCPLEVKSDLPGGGMRLYADARGYDYVLVNGVPVVDHDAYTGAQPGIVLRRGRDTYTATIPAARQNAA
ncbi:MAG: amidohydrolase family protein [Gammaproteobacteria bacterium]|nr:amidohydrolase family protein [Gammaproteobacteria bacterium]MYK83068.1 amidohydrolase family protein [Gammaproteobacteria bacterium]